MAIFEGTVREFTDFIGPLTRNIVCNLSRKLKKNTSCKHDGCKKRKNLEAAHIKGKERTVLIADILSEYQLSEDTNRYKVDLEDFKTRFIEAHTPINEVIIPLCKEHHLAYDNKYGIAREYPIVLQLDEGSYTEEELTKLEKNENKAIEKSIASTPVGKIKNEVAAKLNLKTSQLAFSRISESNDLWNFDIKKSKFKQDFAFIFYDQNSKEYKIGLVKANALKVSVFPKKDKETIRFFVSKDYKDKTGFEFDLSS